MSTYIWWASELTEMIDDDNEGVFDLSDDDNEGVMMIARQYDDEWWW